MFTTQEKEGLAEILARALKEYIPIQISGLTTAGRFDGVPIANAAILLDGSVVILTRVRLRTFHGRPINLVLTSHEGNERLVGIEYRGQIIFPSEVMFGAGKTTGTK